MAEMDKGRRNINLTLATKLPKKSEDWLFDPMVKDRDLKQLLCLKPGMRVKTGEGAFTKEALIRDFSRGVIETEGNVMGLENITEKMLDSYKHVEVQQEENGSWKRITSLQNVVVKRNPVATASIINKQAEQGDVATISSIVEKGAAEIASKAPFGLTGIRTKKGAVHKKTNGLEGEDLAYRHINRLPYFQYVKPLEEPNEFKCNLCEERIEVLSARKKEKKMAIENRVLKHCIVEDRRALEDGELKGCVAQIDFSMDFHGRVRHLQGIPHHFASPKMPMSVWAWEMSVRYVAQILLEQSLFQVGMNKFVFKQLVETGQEGPVCGQICAILGGAISESKIEFHKKLVGVKYDGLYLPGGAMDGSMPSLKELKTIRTEALKKVVRRAQDWIRDQLLPEMRAFNYSTMVAAMVQEEDKQPVVKTVPGTKRELMIEKERKKREGKKKALPVKNIDRVLCVGYIWNAMGLFFRRGVFDDVNFPPAKRSMSDSRSLDYTVWDALEEIFISRVKSEEI